MATHRLCNYAESMFRFEHLHDGWIRRCARYLESVFGEGLKGATVLDYAFGRGNWALAFRMAGADRVIAVDAAPANVSRLADYCKRHAVTGIDAREGNLLEAPLNVDADLLWIYGILHHIDDAPGFLDRLRPIARDERSCAYFYAYDGNSLRELVVTTCRRWVRYATETEFRSESLLYTPAARHRVQDDLTAPYIRWYQAAELANLLAGHGFSAQHQGQGFDVFETGERNEEFQPHQLVCTTRDARTGFTPAEPPRAHDADIALLRHFVDAVFEIVDFDDAARRRLAIGLANTHFTALATQSFEGVLLQDYLFLLHALLASNHEGDLPPSVSESLELARRAIVDEERATIGISDRFLDRYLRSHSIRV